MNVHYAANPSDVSTGSYEGTNAKDEQLFAATELLIATGDASYKMQGTTGNVSYWGDVSGIATYGKATHAELFDDGAEAKEKILSTADDFVSRASTGFGVVMADDDFAWGSNAVAANQGVWLLHAYYLTGEKKYYETAVKVLDYLLGKNPLDMSFVTGYGTKSPMMPHHRPSTADNVTDPVPGMIVGGPQPGGEDIPKDMSKKQSWECDEYRTGKPATSYIDDRCSYATNEVAINWNAPFAYLAGAIEAISAGQKVNFGVERVSAAAATDTPSDKPSTDSSSPEAIRPSVVRDVNVQSSPRLRFADQMLYVEKNGKRFNLKGHRIK